MKLGCIGDDFTGSSDLANTLAKEGTRVTQYCGVPSAPAGPDVEAGVVALKSRTIPVPEAVALSLAAADWLAAQGCVAFMFKICSTFDSTPEGNIGRVAEALMDRLGRSRALVCPAFPAAGRTVWMGHLFVGDRLLSETGMRDHPLTPMTDPDIRRWLGRQSRRAVGHVGPPSLVGRGFAAAVAAEASAGRPLVVADALTDVDLRSMSLAMDDETLVVGGSGIALGLPARLGIARAAVADWRGERGPAVALAGSCSEATLGQVAAFDGPVRRVTPDEAMAGADPQAAADWALAQAGPALIASSAEPAAVAAAQARHGREQVAAAIETFFADTARALVAGGARRLVAAGGETSGAVVEGLGLSALSIGPEIAPGAPALRAEGRPLTLALKSGNFGGPDFFARAFAALEAGT